MQTAGSRRIEWPGGRHLFCLAACGTVLALEDSRKSSLASIYTRLVNSLWFANDICETIRLGLVGGGMGDQEADKAVAEFVEANPNGMFASVHLAMSILEAAIVGVPDDVIRKEAKPASEGQSDQSFHHEDGRMKRSAILGLGAGLGWSPSETYAASIWEIAACIEGYNKANGVEDKSTAPSNEEFDAMLERHNIKATVQ